MTGFCNCVYERSDTLFFVVAFVLTHFHEYFGRNDVTDRGVRDVAVGYSNTVAIQQH